MSKPIFHVPEVLGWAIEAGPGWNRIFPSMANTNKGPINLPNLGLSNRQARSFGKGD